MIKKQFILIFITLLLPIITFSQGEWNKWYFGWYAALDFNSGTPVGLTSNVMAEMNTNTTISDSLGNLLFYANFEKVYNRNHIVMPNGSGLLGTPMAGQNVLAIPKPGEDSIYYIFTVGDGNIGYPLVGLHYSILDMRLDGGLGDIIPFWKNKGITAGADAFQQLTAIRHHNNRDIWLVVRKYENDKDQYASFLITNSGIDSIPVLSPCLRNTPSGYDGLMRISPDGTKLICIPDSVSEFCTFNSITGVVLPLFSFQSSKTSTSRHLNGIEFSIDSKLLYCTPAEHGAVDSVQVLLQYDATSIDSLNFMQSEVVVGYDVSRNIQLGPDWKIYCSPSEISGIFEYTLHVITNPNVQGIGCNFQQNAVNLVGRRAVGSLPQFLQKYKAYIHDSSHCQNHPVWFTGDIWPPADSIHWDFGDPGSGSNNFSNADTSYHIYTNPGQYTITLFVRHIDNRTDTSWKTITIYPTPVVSLGPDKIICSGDSVVFDAGSCSGCSYIWRELISGDTVSITQTYKADSSGIYSVEVTGEGNCKGSDTVQLVVTMQPLITTSPLNKALCSGDSTRILLSANVIGTTFSWSVSCLTPLVSGFSAGTGDTINQKLISTSAIDETVTYWITPTAGNCTGDSVAYVVTVLPGDSVSVSIAASQNPVCEGTSVTFTATPVNGGTTPVFQWYINGIPVGANSPVFTYFPGTGDQVTCDLTSSETVCVTNNPATSNTITMIVNPNNPVSVSIAASQNPICEGTSVTYTATPMFGGTNPSYQWKVNGINIGINSPVFTYTPLNNDIVTCILTSSETACVTNNPATSNQVIMTVNPNLPVSVSISSTGNPVCEGTLVTYTATPVNGGTMPSYQWYVNGIPVGINSPVFTYVPGTGDQVTCDLTSSETVCVINNPATSNAILMVVDSNLLVSLSIAASANPVCSGTSVTYTATPVNEGTNPSYQWKVNGINSGLNNPVFVYIPVNNDIVTCVLTSSETVCVINNPATSNAVTMAVNPVMPVSITIAASANPVCEGTSVTYTATPINGGTTPVFQWYVNGMPVGTNSPIFTYVPSNGNSVSCLLTSDYLCTTGNPATSNTIVMNVVAKPVVTFQACFDTITSVNAKPIKLKGGIPLGGTYSGPGVNTGIFYPAIAGAGTHVITYTYTNAGSCSDNAQLSIVNYPLSIINCGLPITDIRDNKVYPTIQIGTQCWLAANLNYGSPVPSAQYQRDNCIPEKYCYNDLPANCQLPTANSFYQWDELMAYDATPGNQGLCPPAWHVPTEAEWNTLFANYINNGFAGSPLKYSGYSGFNALLTGAKHFNKAWNYNGFAAFFWSSTSWGTTKAWAHGMNDPDPSVSRYPSYRTNAFSVRCIKD